MYVCKPWLLSGGYFLTHKNGTEEKGSKISFETVKWLSKIVVICINMKNQTSEILSPKTCTFEQLKRHLGCIKIINLLHNTVLEAGGMDYNR